VDKGDDRRVPRGGHQKACATTYKIPRAGLREGDYVEK